MSESSKKDKKDLTVSQIDRQNILNNPYALQEIERATRIKGIPFEGKTVVLKEQVSAFLKLHPGRLTITSRNSAKNCAKTVTRYYGATA